MSRRSNGSRCGFTIRRLAPGRAFTLVEMLVAMVLTLILVAAIAEFYAYVGETVKDGRAMIEMSGSLRTAVQRLKSDLDLLTLPVAPWVDDSASGGYFEIGEGLASDCDVNGNGYVDISDTQDTDSPTNNIADFAEPGVTNLVGDADDYLAFTARASGSPWSALGPLPRDPTVNDGQIKLQDSTQPPQPQINLPVTTVLSANFAEIVWWTSFQDTDLDGRWDLNEPRFIVRRQMLIRPDLNVVHPADTQLPSTPYYFRVPSGSYGMTDLLQDFDVSFRYAQTQNGFDYYVANSLMELGRRENRYMHLAGAANFPNPVSLTMRVAGGIPTPAQSVNTAVANSQYRWLLRGRRQGEDIVLSNVLAMDVKVYDQGAVLLSDTAQANLGTGAPTDAINALAPGDPGYLNAINAANPRIGLGAYVDLGYRLKLISLLTNAPYNNGTAATTVNNVYNAAPALFGTAYVNPVNASLSLGFPTISQGLVYDTWPLSYERDGLNQNYPSTSNINTAPFDEGTNGLDDDSINGVDDPGERETRPPYASPLRGIQITIRVYEPGTRQMRQATVKTDFINE